MKAYKASGIYYLLFSAQIIATVFGVPFSIFSFIDKTASLDVKIFASMWLILVPVAWYRGLQIPIKIIVHDDGTVVFKSYLKTVIIPISEIQSISFVPLDLQNHFRTLRYAHGKLYITSRLDDFPGFLHTIKEMNPKIITVDI